MVTECERKELRECASVPPLIYIKLNMDASCLLPNLPSSLLSLPPDVLGDLLQLLRCDRKDWDSLRCTCKALRTDVSKCISTAVITAQSSMLQRFPKDSILKRLRMQANMENWDAWKWRRSLDPYFESEADVLATLVRCMAADAPQQLLQPSAASVLSNVKELRILVGFF